MPRSDFQRFSKKVSVWRWAPSGSYRDRRDRKGMFRLVGRNSWRWRESLTRAGKVILLPCGRIVFRLSAPLSDSHENSGIRYCSSRKKTLSIWAWPPPLKTPDLRREGPREVDLLSQCSFFRPSFLEKHSRGHHSFYLLSFWFCPNRQTWLKSLLKWCLLAWRSRLAPGKDQNLWQFLGLRIWWRVQAIPMHLMLYLSSDSIEPAAKSSLGSFELTHWLVLMTVFPPRIRFLWKHTKTF